MTASLPMTFLGLDGRDADYDRSRYVVWPVGYDATVSYRTGTRDGPGAIIQASRQVELFDPQLGKEIHRLGVATLAPFDPDVSSPQASLEAIYRRARRIVLDGKFLITLGGEHSITGALIRAHAERIKDFSVLHIDAHLDMRDTWQHSRYSHACVLRRVHELAVPTVSFGIRNISREEHRYLRHNPFAVFTADRVHRDPCSATAEAIDLLGQRVYVTIDMDGFDPAYAPGVGTPEPGGLDWFVINDLLTTLVRNRRIIAADIVETLPIPGQVVTEFLAAKLAARIIALTQLAEKGHRRAKKR